MDNVFVVYLPLWSVYIESDRLTVSNR